jgi:hypothetical protein
MLGLLIKLIIYFNWILTWYNLVGCVVSEDVLLWARSLVYHLKEKDRRNLSRCISFSKCSAVQYSTIS